MSKKVTHLTVGLNTLFMLWILLIRHYLISAVDGYTKGWPWYEALPKIYSNIDFIVLLAAIALLVNTVIITAYVNKHP
ncbi:MAG: hypothetical protein ABGF52_13170 [Candidatus Asgardarchaeum sp.]|nr:hypothetical protein [Candidatus Odinarchaeota archaeon]